MGASKRLFMEERRKQEDIRGYYPSYREINKQPITKNQYNGKRRKEHIGKAKSNREETESTVSRGRN